MAPRWPAGILAILLHLRAGLCDFQVTVNSQVRGNVSFTASWTRDREDTTQFAFQLVPFASSLPANAQPHHVNADFEQTEGTVNDFLPHIAGDHIIIAFSTDSSDFGALLASSNSFQVVDPNGPSSTSDPISPGTTPSAAQPIPTITVDHTLTTTVQITATATATSTNTCSNSGLGAAGKSGIQPGIIVGSIIGGLLLGVLIVAAFYLVLRRRGRSGDVPVIREKSDSESSDSVLNISNPPTQPIPTIILPRQESIASSSRALPPIPIARPEGHEHIRALSESVMQRIRDLEIETREEMAKLTAQSISLREIDRDMRPSPTEPPSYRQSTISGR
ncbi:hypothetical protein C8J56DRAFT_949516 [Mycena floridula]|nr:hypothetical protein C8J56DRAFT_949516 [Mycena floridula]